MIRNHRFLVFLLAVAVSAPGMLRTAAASPSQRSDPGTNTCRILTNENSGPGSPGHRLFQKSCKNCHFRANDKGAPFLHAESYAMAGWNRIFFTKYPACAQNGSWAALAAEELVQVNDYLFRNAADAYDPYKASDCG